ncbi:MAG TPA: DNA-binding protein WhiA [Bacillota bacterium]|nr:DNA-binding protein WhiA [Bacillota bacterium]
MEKFSQLVRDELVQSSLTTAKHCIKAELAAIIHILGSLHLTGNQRFSLSISTFTAGVARRAVQLIKASYGLESEVQVEQNEKLGKQHRYNLIIPDQEGLRKMIVDLGMMTREHTLEGGINPDLVKENCCRTAFLRGIFIAGGSITDPHRRNYHLEMVTQSEDLANGLVYLMNLVGLKAKVSRRKEHYLVYLKEIEALIRFLSLIGAHVAVLKLEEIRVVKGLRGEVNRRLNFETANLEKTLSAAMELVQEIEKLRKEPSGLNLLPPKLRETALLRLEYPEASLKELAEYHQPPISKSAVNHRLRLIREYGKKFTNKEGI